MYCALCDSKCERGNVFRNCVQGAYIQCEFWDSAQGLCDVHRFYGWVPEKIDELMEGLRDLVIALDTQVKDGV